MNILSAVVLQKTVGFYAFLVDRGLKYSKCGVFWSGGIF